jgi:hypothetical protein
MQGPNAENGTMVDYGSEGYSNPVHKFVYCNNTLINKRSPGTFVRVANGTVEMFLIINNIFAGFSAFSANAFPAHASDTSNNFRTTDIGSLYLAEENKYDYHLTANSPVIDKGVLWGAPDHYTMEYKHKCDSSMVDYDNPVEIGAYQFVKPTGIKDDSKKTIALINNGSLSLSQFEDSCELSAVRIYSLAGGCLLVIDGYIAGTEIDVSSLNEGVYFCSIRTDNKVEHLMFYISK